MSSALTSSLVCVVEVCVSAHSSRCLNNHSIADIIHLDQIMKIIQLHIYLFMLYQATESLTNIPVTLGSDVIITCDLDIEEIYWYIQKLPDPPVLILRTFSSTYEKAEYGNIIFKDKYSVKTNSRLFIKNITIDESGVYYCVKTSEPKFNNGTKIYISDFVQKNMTDSVHRNQTDDAPQHQISWRNMTIIISVLLNVLLTIALIGVVKNCLHATRRSNNSSEKPPNTAAQYAEIESAISPGGSRPGSGSGCQDQTIYSLLQPIKLNNV